MRADKRVVGETRTRRRKRTPTEELHLHLQHQVSSPPSLLLTTHNTFYLPGSSSSYLWWRPLESPYPRWQVTRRDQVSSRFTLRRRCWASATVFFLPGWPAADSDSPIMSSRRGSDNGDATKSHPEGGGGPTINGSIEAMLTPELLFRMNKKIAQLTKVISRIFIKIT